MANASLDLHNRGLFQHAVPPPYGYLGAEELRELMSHRAGDHIRISGRPDWTNLGLTFRDYLDARSMLPTSAELISLPPDGSLDDLRRTAEERIWTLAEPFLAKQLSVATIQAWSEELARVSPGSEAALAPYLSDPALLLQNLRIGHFEEVADATIVNTPEIFRSLFVLASELQMAQYALMRRWLALEHPSDAEFSRGEKALLSKFGSAMKDFNGGHLTQSHLTKDFTGPQMRDFAGKDDE